MATDPKAIAVARSLRQSLEQNAGAGSAINSHPNPFYAIVSGPVDLLKMAEAALAGAERYEASVKANFESAVKAFIVKIRAELAAGAKDIGAALTSLKQKGVEPAEDVVDAAVLKVKEAPADKDV
jgi:hypothetical protein